jgi:hypothetical protein
MTKAAVADHQDGLAELVQHSPHDARTRQYDFGPLGLKTDYLAALVGVGAPVDFDLPVDFVSGDVAPWTRSGS